jgi:hypothetical protein
MTSPEGYKIECHNHDSIRETGLFFGPRQAAQRVESEGGILHDPCGKKASEKMPQLAFISGQIGLKKAQANQAELR